MTHDTNQSLPARVARALDAAGDATGPALLELLSRRHADDPELLRELRELLGNGAGAVPVLDDATPDLDGTRPTHIAHALALLRQPEAHELPDRIGRYRVLRLLGQGGMGVVYECEQQEPQRRVAVKVLHVGLGAGIGHGADGAWDQGREAQVLARLTHPGIARVIESGRDRRTGRWFVAMELVEGAQLLAHVRDAGLSIRARVELIARVCDAVEHAHQKGVIHRDLKPSNIMVEKDDAGTLGPGRPRVLDFGVAKLLDAPSAQSLVAPGSSSIVGTLGYISPEGLGEGAANIDTRADVYSLGVVLFEVLAGRKPIDLAGVPLSEVARRVQETPAPSVALHNPSLRGDLSSIVAKALCKEPSLRYGSAGELGSDLRRYLAGEAVLAHAPSAVYLARKFVSRHKALSTMALAMVLLLAGGLATSLVLYARAERARAEERTQRQVASTIRDYFVRDVVGAASPERMGYDVKVVDVLDALASEVGSRFPGQPELEGNARFDLATVFDSLGKYDQSIEQASAAVPLLAATRGETDPLVFSARSQIATAQQSAGRSTEAEVVAREALAKLGGGLPPDDPRVLRTLGVLGGSLHAQGKAAESIPILEDVIARQASNPQVPPVDLASTRLQLAAALSQVNREDQARTQLRQALGDAQTSYTPSHPVALAARNNLVQSLFKAGALDEAYSYAKDLPDLAAAGLPPDHPAQAYSAMTLSQLLVRMKRPDDAMPWALRGHERMVASAGPLAWQTERSANNVLRIALQQGDKAASRTWADATIAMRLSLANLDEHKTVVAVFNDRAKELRKLFPEISAESIVLDAFATRASLFAGDSPRRARALAHLGLVCFATGHLDQARALLAECKAIVKPGEADADAPAVIASLEHSLSTIPDASR